ncbi:GbsR/MarR family transcriptional regulator [Truepera radiovictrix]|uniref:Transcriptional regulator, MarR family n=1 Tax=Truepera radiovictrix (strain DSM 17093 / CIP 108686 / LMG 22925 / RQ-24) TaxID=649638 RepID=D7CW36_TRURR|nr:MarR family transcriptional regulator [Truepera radiovictrix]ADI14299.1 transcriptional regulator, MarR family [Truepera radiovictrix DSM 17093]WMT57145.1 MarR family transcriptional regulator [Truepera radiovictrix]
MAPKMADDKAAFIEEMGLLMAGLGLPRMAGRVFGALLLADPPEMSAEELAGALRASRGSISAATRMLERAGIIDRVRRPGERRDRYRNRPNAWNETLKTRLAIIGTFKAMAERGLALLETDDPEVRRGLVEMRDYFAHWERELPALLQRWDASARED